MTSTGKSGKDGLKMKEWGKNDMPYSLDLSLLVGYNEVKVK